MIENHFFNPDNADKAVALVDSDSNTVDKAENANTRSKILISIFQNDAKKF